MRWREWLLQVWDRRDRPIITATFIAVFIYGNYLVDGVIDDNTNLDVVWMIRMHMAFAAGGAAALMSWWLRIR